jgi:peptide/nickel transport system substrate-binding protein/oligopeptide transport system substrate-binding protein
LRHPLRKAIIRLLALTLATILLAGCAAPWPFAQPTPDPKLPDSQQILHPLAVGTAGGPAFGDVETLDPARIEFSSDQQIAQLLFPQLVTLDEQNKPVDWAASSHEVSADGLTYTFHVRKGMAWSDGTPINAQTFAYSINRALDPCAQASTAYYLYPIKGAKAFNNGVCPTGATKSATSLIGTALLVPDALTLQIQLEQPAGYFLTVLTNPIAWGVPQALVERYPMTPTDYKPAWIQHLTDNGGFGGNLYRLVNWDHRGHLDLQRDERFWGQKPLLRRIEYTLYDGRAADVAWADFKAGVGDIGEPATSVNVTSNSDRHYAQEVAAARMLKGVQVTQSLLASISFLRPNWKVAPFDDARVRQAFSLALDRQALAQLRPDQVQPSIHLVPEGVPGYNPALADAAGHTGKDALSANVATARQLASAYAAEKCGGSFAACPLVNITEGFGSAREAAIAQTIKRQWETAFPGWSITIGVLQDLQINDIWRDTVQLLLAGWLEDYPDPQSFLSQLFTPPSPYDRSVVSIPEVNALCAQADASSDQPTRLKLYQQAEQALVTQGAAIPLYQTIQTTVVRSHVVGWRLAPTGMTPLSVWQTTYIRQ